jgi:hypothetical protein
MKKAKDLLIVEMSSSALKVTSSEEKDYVLEGVFGQIDQKIETIESTLKMSMFLK